MATTINAQNALQIREKPMEVYISLQVGSSAKISNYAPSGTYKSYDSTLGNSSYTMRNVADLAGEGFPLDGSYRLYDPNEATSSSNGKLGLRGNAGQDVAVTITASATLTAVTVSTRGVGSIAVGGTSYPSTGNNIIPINARTATLTFSPAVNNGRAEVDYIVPGITLSATNDTLTRCTLALRGNLAVIDHTWEESEIEIEMYYPYDISSSFAYVQNEWPITYRAGYDGDLSTERKFYLSEPVEMKDNIITIKGVDASHKLNDKTMPEQWLDVRRSNAHQAIYAKFVDAIKSAGITIQRQQSWSGTATGVFQHAILPEMSARDFVAGTMNLTLNHTNGSNKYGIQFVDAGIPTVEHGDGRTYGNTWTIFKSDCGDFNEQFERNIAKVQDSNDERKFYEIMTPARNVTNGNIASKVTGEVGQEFEYNFDGYYYLTYVGAGFAPTSSDYAFSFIANTPSRVFFRITRKGTKPFSVTAFPVSISGGHTAYSNPNGLPGQTIEMEPFIYGSIADTNNHQVFHIPSLFARSTRTGSFVWKGDPRMQPLDYLVIVNDTNDGRGNITARATSIELVHEGGGTTATINWREWEIELSGTVLADENGAVLIDNNGDFLSAE